MVVEVVLGRAQFAIVFFELYFTDVGEGHLPTCSFQQIWELIHLRVRGSVTKLNVARKHDSTK